MQMQVQNSSDHIQRTQKKREKNRIAQQRFRLRQKVCIRDTFTEILVSTKHTVKTYVQSAQYKQLISCCVLAWQQLVSDLQSDLKNKILEIEDLNKKNTELADENKVQTKFLTPFSIDPILD